MWGLSVRLAKVCGVSEYSVRLVADSAHTPRIAALVYEYSAKFVSDVAETWLQNIEYRKKLLYLDMITALVYFKAFIVCLWTKN